MPNSLKIKGFTLIELMVVVAILGILAVIGFSTFAGMQSNARDAKRKADVDAIAHALEDKYNAGSGEYLQQSDLIGTDFTSGSVPKDNDTSYYFKRTNDKKAFVVCTNTLEKSSQPYCRYSTNGSTTSIASLSTPAPVIPSPTPTAAPTSTPAPTAPACSTNFPQTCVVGIPGSSVSPGQIFIDCPSSALDCSKQNLPTGNIVLPFYNAPGASTPSGSAYFLFPAPGTPYPPTIWSVTVQRHRNW